MKLTKKLLTVLPLATIGCVTPVVVSGCSCATSYVINYGDTIDCKNKDDKNYHSIDQVKEVANGHKQIFPEQKMKADKLLKWKVDGSESQTTQNQQFFYWDLVYSVASKNTAFKLVWNFTDAKTKKSCSGGTFNDVNFTELSYTFNSDGKVVILSGSINVESQAYQYVTQDVTQEA